MAQHTIQTNRHKFDTQSPSSSLFLFRTKIIVFATLFISFTAVAFVQHNSPSDVLPLPTTNSVHFRHRKLLSFLLPASVNAAARSSASANPNTHKVDEAHEEMETKCDSRIQAEFTSIQTDFSALPDDFVLLFIEYDLADDYADGYSAIIEYLTSTIHLPTGSKIEYIVFSDILKPSAMAMDGHSDQFHSHLASVGFRRFFTMGATSGMIYAPGECTKTLKYKRMSDLIESAIVREGPGGFFRFTPSQRSQFKLSQRTVTAIDKRDSDVTFFIYRKNLKVTFSFFGVLSPPLTIAGVSDSDHEGPAEAMTYSSEHSPRGELQSESETFSTVLRAESRVLIVVRVEHTLISICRTSPLPRPSVREYDVEIEFSSQCLFSLMRLIDRKRAQGADVKVLLHSAEESRRFGSVVRDLLEQKMGDEYRDAVVGVIGYGSGSDRRAIAVQNFDEVHVLDELSDRYQFGGLAKGQQPTVFLIPRFECATTTESVKKRNFAWIDLPPPEFGFWAAGSAAEPEDVEKWESSTDVHQIHRQSHGVVDPDNDIAFGKKRQMADSETDSEPKEAKDKPPEVIRVAKRGLSPMDRLFRHRQFKPQADEQRGQLKQRHKSIRRETNRINFFGFQRQTSRSESHTATSTESDNPYTT